MKYRIPYGKGYLRFSLPSKRVFGILENKKGQEAGIKKILADSLDGKASKTILKRISGSKGKILIVVPDMTRKAHLEAILPALLKRLKGASCAIDIIIATGLHKKHDARQIKDLVGETVLRCCRVYCHDQHGDSIERRGVTSSRIPVTLNRKVREYSHLISVGVIEPHLYAGYSGGAKTIAIGLAGEATINATHNVRFLDDTRTGLGLVRNNPFQDTLWRLIKGLPVKFAVNSVNDPDGRPLNIFSGKINDVFRKGVSFSEAVFEVRVDKQADIAICGVGYPKDINLYQASRAINYVANVRHPVLRKGGILIVAAELLHGTGAGISEKRFYEELRRMKDPKKFLERTKFAGCIAGVHRAYMIARPMIDYKIVFVSRGNKGFMRNLPFPCFSEIGAALRYAEKIVGKKTGIYVIPHVLSTIANVAK